MPDVASFPNQGTLHRERMQFERDFTQLPNQWMRDKRLSFGARGLLAHLMTHDVGYQISLAGLAGATWKEGRDGIRTLVAELERAGYLHRPRSRRQKGQFSGYAWILQDPFALAADPSVNQLLPVDKSPSHRVGSADVGSAVDGSAASAGTTTIEDQIKNKDHVPAQPQEPLDAPVDNFGSITWPEERCPGNWRDGRHELSEHGMCKHCHERPHVVRSAS
jgi:hypothetical protein